MDLLQFKPQSKHFYLLNNTLHLLFMFFSFPKFVNITNAFYFYLRQYLQMLVIQVNYNKLFMIKIICVLIFHIQITLGKYTLVSKLNFIKFSFAVQISCLEFIKFMLIQVKHIKCFKVILISLKIVDSFQTFKTNLILT